MKKLQGIIISLIIIILGIIIIINCANTNTQVMTIKSDKDLLALYDRYTDYNSAAYNNILLSFATMPFSWSNLGAMPLAAKQAILTTDTIQEATATIGSLEKSTSDAATSTTSNKDYSTTNIQVENVDEADITKTDGDYIYSISDNSVIITDVRNPEAIKISSKIESTTEFYPEDLLLYKNKLVIISEKVNNASYYYQDNNTNVRIYDITTKESPKLVKSYELYEPYYTSRCIDNVLYVISSGTLRKNDNGLIEREYKEDYSTKEIELENIKYLKDVKTRKQTLISVVDLDNAEKDVKVSSYIIDVSNAYVSENSIYLLDQKYKYNNSGIMPLKSIFGLKGIIGAFEYYDNDEESGYYTKIYKFNIDSKGEISYKAKKEIKGKTINQYSLDEKNNHLRIALYDNDGARIAIFDENLDKIGISEYVAKGETMYSSRFMNNKVYLVTYKTMDPLFVIDLSDESNPEILGELHIPGYSTYLHPYDDNHLIGIGMQTEEKVNRNSSGKITSTRATITGMKMALFDVSDVSKPKQISETIIGDSRTTSAILTNPKALLFSKERGLIAIPVNNYKEDFEVNVTDESYSSIQNAYINYKTSYVAEGYFVYNINLEDGFKLKGIITHETENNRNDYYYYNNSKLLRGLYIEDNLYTISETAIKVNKLETLDLIEELKIK